MFSYTSPWLLEFNKCYVTLNIAHMYSMITSQTVQIPQCFACRAADASIRNSLALANTKIMLHLFRVAFTIFYKGAKTVP